MPGLLCIWSTKKPLPFFFNSCKVKLLIKSVSCFGLSCLISFLIVFLTEDVLSYFSRSFSLFVLVRDLPLVCSGSSSASGFGCENFLGVAFVLGADFIFASILATSVRTLGPKRLVFSDAVGDGTGMFVGDIMSW